MHEKYKIIFLFVNAAILIIAAFLHPVTAFTQDLGRHLLTGEFIVKNFSVPKINLYSYTYPDFPFINHHWFSEVIFYSIYSTTGVNGLLIFSVSIVSLSFLILLFFQRKKHFLGLFVSSILYLHILQDRTDVRPEIFSYLYLSLFVSILYSFKNKFTKLIFLLPFIQLLWTNSHIYFPIGIAILGLFFIDNVYENRTSIYYRFSHIPYSTKILFFILFISSMITLVNPSGFEGAIYPFTVFNNYGYSIEENQTLFFIWNYSQKPIILWLITTMGVLILSLLFSLQKIKLIDILLSILFIFLCFNAIRNFPLFVFGTFIIFTTYFSTFIDTFFSKKITELQSFLVPKYIILLLLPLITFWQFKQLSTFRDIRLGEEPGAQKAADFFIENKLKGPIFNNFDIGSYITYRMYPKEKVFIDGRPETYPKEFIQNVYIPMQENPDIFMHIDNKYNLNTIFFAHTDQTPWGIEFLKWISKDPKWKQIYLDDYVVIYIKDTTNNASVIKKLTSDYKIQYNSKDIISLYRTALYFEKIQSQKDAYVIYKDILRLQPDNCFALFHLLQFEKDLPLSHEYDLRFNNNCL